MAARAVFAALVVLLGCGDDRPSADAGPSDARAGMDAPPPADAGGVDAGPRDATLPPIDAGSSDATLPPIDSGTPMPEGCIDDVSAGHRVFTCEDIPYDVEISTACAAGGCGMILDVHGATMDAAVEDLNTNLRALGSAAGYVVVQPTGPDTSIGPQWDPARDDPKIFRFVELALRALAIDRRRVHFTGFSQGGFMTWRMLCQHADVFASVAPAAACGALFPHCDFSASERPSREIPVLYMHGRNDTVVSSCANGQRDAVVSGWSMTEDSVVSADPLHRWTRYRGASGNVFEHIDHAYSAYSYLLSGHCFPGSPDIGTSRFGTSGFGCDNMGAFHWGEAVVAFFRAHPRR